MGNLSELRQAHLPFQAMLYQSRNPTRRWLHTVRTEWVNMALEQVSGRAPHILEIGIGCGVYTRQLASQGTVLAIDINPTFVAAASLMPNVIARVADITRERFAPEHDVALCSEVLEHVVDSSTALKNIYASLKPGGFLVLTTPNAYSTVELAARLLCFAPIQKLARMIYGESVDDLGHINRMTRTQLRAQITAAGFLVLRQADIAFYLPGIAEFCGARGLRLCQWLGRKLAGTRLSFLLWTQCWVLCRPC